jgi:formamidopyrimidine-DNA glycosylase
MPELPEVEVARRGIAPHVEGQVVTGVALRHTGLRWPFPPNLASLLTGQAVLATARRGKYLLIEFAHGSLIVHLGMSGHLRILPAGTPPQAHDHFDLELGKRIMRLTDPRRFGAVLWHGREQGPVSAHVLLHKLGVEPLDADFSGEWLYRATRSRRAPIKQVLLAGDIVVGVGNIYASESLFKARIHPKTAAHRIGLARYRLLAEAIREILAAAIAQGGSSLRDYLHVNGQSGYFQQSYFVYNRAGAPCRVCGAAVRQLRQGQRSTFYCANCQK